MYPSISAIETVKKVDSTWRVNYQHQDGFNMVGIRLTGFGSHGLVRKESEFVGRSV